MNPLLKDYFQRFKPQNQNRLYNNKLEINKFFTNLSSAEYHQKLPYLFAVENFCIRLLEAYLKKQKICIYSDYDTDAVTATATMYWGLSDLGFATDDMTFYAPDRFVEGYGMNPDAIHGLSWLFDLIISVDCGINSVLEADVVKQINQQKPVDLIITDHHSLQQNIPDCVAVVNPRLTRVYAEELLKRKKEGVDQKSIDTNTIENSVGISPNKFVSTQKVDILDFEKRFSSIDFWQMQQNGRLDFLFGDGVLQRYIDHRHSPLQNIDKNTDIPGDRQKMGKYSFNQYFYDGLIQKITLWVAKVQKNFDQIVEYDSTEDAVSKPNISDHSSNAASNTASNTFSSDISRNVFVSESVTGVGVAWFSLVWFAYFLEDIFDTNFFG